LDDDFTCVDSVVIYNLYRIDHERSESVEQLTNYLQTMCIGRPNQRDLGHVWALFFFH